MSRPPSQKKRPFVLARSIAALLSLTLLLGAQKAAADQYWDGTTTGGSNVPNGAGGSGTWDNVTTNWVDATGNSPAVYDPNQTAHFSTTGGTITLGDNISFTELRFDADGYTVDAGASFTLTPTSATGTINAQTGVTVTINPQLTGAGGISFQGGGTIVLTNTGNDYAGTTTIGSGGSGPTLVINSDGELGSSGAAITFDGGTLRTTANVSNARSIGLNSGGGILAPDSGTTLTLNGTISGTGTLTVSGSGSVALGNTTNSYTGGTNIVGGTLVVSSDGNLGDSSGPLSFNGGTLVTTAQFGTQRSVVLSGTGGSFAPSSGQILELEGTITGSGGLNMVGAGILQFFGTSNSYTGPTVVSSGMLRTVAANAMSSASALTVNSGATFDLNFLDQKVGSIAGAGTISLGSGTLTAGQDNSSTLFSGTIQDGGSHGGLTKVGTGTLTLTGANSYLGATTVNGGTLLIDPATHPTVLNSSSKLTVGGGTFQLNGIAATTASQTLNGLTVTSGSSEIAVNNLGTTTTLDLRGTSGTLGINHIGGSVDFSAITGTLGVDAIIKTHQANDATGIIGIWATVNGGSAFAANNGSDVIVAYGGYTDIAAMGDIVPNGAGLNVRINSAVGPRGNVDDILAAKKTNINTLSQNTGTDSIIDLADGTLRVGNTGGILITSTGANLTIGATANSGTLTAGGSINNTARQLGLSNNSATSLLTINSVIADDGNGVVSVTVGGSGITSFVGNNTYTGSTTITSGTLRTDAANTIPIDSAVLVNTGGTLSLNDISATVGSIADGAAGGGTISLGSAMLTTGHNDKDTTFSGSITGTGGLIKTGTGTLTLSGTSSYSGSTILNDGRLDVNSTSALGLSTSPLVIHGGTLGTTVASGITIGNPVTLLGDFSVATNVDTSSPGNQNLTFSGTVNLGGNTRIVTGVTPGGQVHFGNTISNGSIILTTNAAVDSDTSNPYVAFIYDGSAANTYTGLTMVAHSAILVFQGTMPANTAVKGNVDIEDNGIVDYLGVSNQIADGTTVTVNSTGSNIGGTSHFDGFELRNNSDTIGTLNGSGTVGLGSGTLTIATGGNFTGVIEDGAFGTGGNLTMNGTGTLTLSGKNTYTGATSITLGTLQAGAVDTLSVASAITIGSGGTLDLNGFSQQTASITGSGAITLGSGTLTTGLKNTSTTFSGVISGTGGLTKSGTGTLTLTLTGNNPNTYTGNTTVTRGTLTITPTTVGTPVLNSGSTLVLGGSAANDGGTFRLTGIAGNATSQALNGLIVNAGNNFVIVDNINALTTTTTLDLGTFITRNSNGFVDFSATNGTLGSTVHIKTTQANDASGILGAWATVNNGSDFATKNAANEIVGLSTIAGGYTDIAATFDTVPNGSNLNVRINSAVGVPPTGNMNDVIAVHPVTSINTLTQNFTTASTIELAGGTLQLGSDGGILITPTNASLTIGATVNDGVLTAASSGGPANITLANNSAAGTLTINSAITDAGGGPVSVRLTGTGLTVFAGSNTYSGSTSILAGTLQLNAANIIPSTSAVTLNAGATLNLNNNSQTVASITDGANGGGNIMLGSATLTTGSNNSDGILSGVISGSGNLVKVGTGTLTLAGNNTYTGNTTLTSGGLTLNSNTALGTGAGTLTIQSGTIGTQKAGGVTITNPVSVQGDFSVFTNVDASNPGNQNFNFNGATFNLNGATRTITGLTNGGQVQWGGAISNGGITFNTSFTKTGDYVAFIYNGANTYTGKTTVNNGAFLVFQGATANAGALGDVDIEGNGVVDYLAGNSAQIADTATVTVNSGGNIAGGQYFGGLDLFNSSAETIGTLNGSVNGVVALGAANLTIGAGDFAGTIYDGSHSGISGGQITKVGSGTLILSGQNFYTGGTTINGGILQISSDQNLGSGAGPLTFGGGTLKVSRGGVESNRLVSLNANATVDVERSGFLQWDGVIQGTGNLIKTGEGNFLITGTSNTFTGTTTVDAGLLALFGNLIKPVTVNNRSVFVLEKDATLTAAGSTPVTVNDRGTFDNFANLTSTGPAGTELTGGPSLFLNESNATLSGTIGVKVDNTAGIKTITNFGTIVGSGGTAIDAQGSLGGVTIANFGTITGQILLGTGVNTIIVATNLPPKSPSPVIPGSAAGTHDTLEMAGGGTDTFDLGPAINFEYLRKVGEGLWNLTGTGNFSAGSTINDGTINLKGTLNSNVLIQPLGTLSGTGFVVGKVNNYGVIMPGTNTNSVVPSITPGTLRLNGDFAQSHGGAMVIQVNGSGANDFSRLTINGHAQLDGSLVVQNGGTLSLKMGQQMVFLSADGGVSGRFSNVTNPFATGTVVIGKLVYGPDFVALEGAQGSFRSIENEFHLTANQKAVATALDSASADSRASKLMAFLDTRPNAQLPGDFDRIAPEEMTSIFRIGASLSDVQGRNVQRRTADLRAGASGFSSSGFQTTGSPNYSGGLAGANGPDESGKTANEAAPNRRWGTFIAGVGDFVHVGDSANARGADLNTGGVTVGADYKLTPELAVGVTVGYTGTDGKLADRGRILVNGGKVGVYGTYYKDHYYVDASVTGGMNNYNTRRTALEGNASGSTQGSEVSGLVDAGYDWRLDALTIGPTATFQYTYVGIDGFAEHGSLAPLRYAGQHATSMRSTIGLHLAYDLKVRNFIVRPEGSLAWQHEYGDRSYSIDSALASGAGDTFTVSDTPIGRDSLLFSAGVAVLWNPRTSTYLYYDADLLKKEYNSQSVTGGLRMNF